MGQCCLLDNAVIVTSWSNQHSLQMPPLLNWGRQLLAYQSFGMYEYGWAVFWKTNEIKIIAMCHMQDVVVQMRGEGAMRIWFVLTVVIIFQFAPQYCQTCARRGAYQCTF